MNVVGRRRLTALRMQLLDHHPFWGYLLVPMRFVPADGLPMPAATDCWRHIWFNPAMIAELNDWQLGFVLMHEVAHLALASEPRRRGRNLQRWNRATEYAINRIVAAIPRHEGGGRLYEEPVVAGPDGEPRRILLDERFDGMTAEIIYEHLLAEDGVAGGSIRLVLPLPGGQGDLVIEAVIDHGGGIDLHLPEWLTEAHREEIAGRIDEALAWWRAGGRGGLGPLPGLVRRAAGGRALGVDWRRIFQALAEECLGKEEYSLARPNRRYLVEDLVVPGLTSERVGELVVALDTSASIEDGFLARAAREIARLAPLAETCCLLVGDAAVRQVVPTDRLAQVLAEGQFPGGGNTDHRPFFAWLEARRLRPALFIGLTDLFSRFPARAPDFPVVWVVPPRHRKAPWGTTIVASS